MPKDTVPSVRWGQTCQSSLCPGPADRGRDGEDDLAKAQKPSHLKPDCPEKNRNC